MHRHRNSNTVKFMTHITPPETVAPYNDKLSHMGITVPQLAVFDKSLALMDSPFFTFVNILRGSS